MNYTLNRPLLDGTSPARLKEIGAVAPEIKDYKSWHTVWLGLAKRAEREQRSLDADEPPAFTPFFAVNRRNLCNWKVY